MSHGFPTAELVLCAQIHMNNIISPIHIPCIDDEGNFEEVRSPKLKLQRPIERKIYLTSSSSPQGFMETHRVVTVKASF